MTHLPRLLYEKSTLHRGYVIIPFQMSLVAGATIYSYALLAQRGREGQFHAAENPAGLYSDQLESIIAIAQDHLDHQSDLSKSCDYFQQRYVYQNNLIIISEIAGKFFYDHYSPDRLKNIAAPKIFASELDCITWVKQGIDRLQLKSVPKI